MFELGKKLIKNIFGFLSLGSLGGVYQILFLVLIAVCIYKLYKTYQFNKQMKLTKWQGKIYKTNTIGFKW